MVTLSSRSYTTRSMILCALFTALTFVGALIRIPFPVVPLTLQVFFVLLGGLLLGPFWGACAQILYVLLAFLGFPILAGGTAGPGIVFLPSFGFLIGFIGGAWISGWFLFRAPQNWSLGRHILGALLGMCVIYLCCLLGLYWNLNYWGGKGLSFYTICTIGLFPFIPGAVVKVIGAVFFAQRIGKHLRAMGYMRA